MPLQATSGAASYDAFGGGVPVVPNYIEEVFSTWLYTGTGSAQTITNGIDLSGKGGLVWFKSRSAVGNNVNVDTIRGGTNALVTNNTDANSPDTGFHISSFNSNGFSLQGAGSGTNANGTTYASWTFRKQPKFFDVATATTNGLSSYGSTTPSMTIAHSLGSVPGCVIVKRTDNTGGWYVWHRSLPALSGLAQTATYAQLNTTGAAAIFGGNVNGTGGWIEATSTHIYLDAWFNTYEPGTFVVYVFAHNAGGFGLTGTDNVISCGSYTGAGASTTVTLGYEPQWVMIRNTSGPFPWWIQDNMRGMTVTGDNGVLNANSSAAEAARGSHVIPTATGFTFTANEGDLNGAGSTYIYIAIRRGPMKVPTSGTSVFSPEAFTGNATTRTIGSITTDSLLLRERASDSWDWSSRLTGSDNYLQTNNTSAESSATAGTRPSFTKAQLGVVYNGATKNQSGTAYIDYLFKRAPSVFDVVCYRGTGSGVRIEHNLQAVPELILIKSRSASGGWAGVQLLPDASDGWNQLSLQSTSAGVTVSSQTGSLSSWMRTYDFFNGYVYRSDGTTPTTNNVNFVAYLFASCAGVSKVGSYTGNGSSQTINCGFTGGARFVLIKKSSGTGDWMVSDSARGIVSGNDPYLELNNTNAEVTSEDWLDTNSTGFVVNEVSGSNANTNGATYIFLAIA